MTTVAVPGDVQSAAAPPGASDLPLGSGLPRFLQLPQNPSQSLRQTVPSDAEGRQTANSHAADKHL